MSTEPKPPTNNNKPKPAPAAVIRKMDGATVSSSERLIKRHIPAWVISGFVHVLLVGVLLLADTFMGGGVEAAQSDAQLTVVPETAEPEKVIDLTNPDLGLDSELPAAVENENLQDINVETAVVTEDPPGVADATMATPLDFTPPPSVGAPTTDAGLEGLTGSFMQGGGGGGSGFSNEGFNGRSAATRSKLVAAGGGNDKSEAAVARGLIWLAKQQKASGAWIYDGAGREHDTAATGMALLPFLAAGQTHKYSKDNKYKANVEGGLKYLITRQSKKDGSFSKNMYAHAIATVALCEALGMTGDRRLLQAPAQAAINFMIAAQGSDGSWGYGPNTNGDTSIVGWQIQALHSAKLCKELVVDKRSLERASRFLDSVASGTDMSQYGYRDKKPSSTLTPVGLLCRYYEGWGPQKPGFAAGVQVILRGPPRANNFNMYYYYYATQVVHFFEGPDWHKTWNPAMRDLLVNKQVDAGKGPNAGSWDPDSSSIGSQCGRLGTTCLCLLTLEVYYRHLPLYKRDNAGLKELERNK